VKTARTRGEDAKVAIRNVRRHSKDHIKTMQKDENLPEDMRFEAEEELQRLTDEYSEKVDHLLEHKEAEIMEV
jgi:ribosome recycling factor